MKALSPPRPTPEQALIIDDDDPGFWLIRGAAGSGKTTTALLRLRFLVPYWRERHRATDLALDSGQDLERRYGQTAAVTRRV